MYNRNQIDLIVKILDAANLTSNNRGYTPSQVMEAMKVYELSGINENLGEIREAVLHLVPEPGHPIVKKLGEISGMLDAVASKIEEK